ncbi:type IIL restriction-modification enzyme MmeI [Hymenobacter daeguensis]
MPAARAAHRTLDARVECLYRAKKFALDTARVQHLCERSADLSAPLAPAAKAPAGSGRGLRRGSKNKRVIISPHASVREVDA